MKTKLILITLVFLSQLALGQTKDERKQALKQVKDKAIKDARKEAKRYEKQGYSTLPGQLPIQKQFEESYVLSAMRDEVGSRKYFVASQEAKAETFAAAEEQARQFCLANIASQINSEIVGSIESNIANAEDVTDATSVTEVVSGYRNTVAQKLGRVSPVITLKKVDKKTKLTYVLMTVAYDRIAAEKVIKDDLRSQLKARTQEKQESIDKLLNFN